MPSLMEWSHPRGRTHTEGAYGTEHCYSANRALGWYCVSANAILLSLEILSVNHAHTSQHSQWPTHKWGHKVTGRAAGTQWVALIFIAT